MPPREQELTRPGYLVIGLCAVLITFVSSAALHLINNGPLVKINVDAEILVLGNSQLLGVRGVETAGRIHNAAFGGSDYSAQNAILKSLSPRMPRLNMLVIGFDNIPLRRGAINSMNGDYRKLVAQGVHWWEIPEITFSERVQYLFRHNKFLEPLVFGPKLDFDRIESLLAAESDHEETKSDLESSAAEIVRPGFQFSPAQGREKMQAYMRDLNSNSHLKVNQKAFLDIIQFCQANDIRVLLARTPTTKAFQDARSLKWDQELAKLHSDASEKFPGTLLPVWDINETEAYPVSMFRDPNHLTTAGLQQYNRQFDTVLSSWID